MATFPPMESTGLVFAAPASAPAASAEGHQRLANRNGVKVTPMRQPPASVFPQASNLLISAGMVATIHTLANRHQRRKNDRRPRPAGLARIARFAEGSSGDASELELEAAKLRAEVEALERSAVAERRSARGARLLRGAQSLKSSALRSNLMEVEKIDLSDAQVEELISSVSSSSEPGGGLTQEQLQSPQFEAALQKFLDEKAAAQRAAQLEANERAAKDAEEKRMQNTFSAGSDGEDTTFPIRLLAVLVYLLPLADVLEYGGPILYNVPALDYFFGLFIPLIALKSMIPFGTFLLLIGFQYLARNQDYPRFVRYNMQQACTIDVLVILPSLIQSFLGLEVPEDVTTALFIITMGCILYSIVVTLLGKVADGLGFISDATKRNIP
eukprot:TRINITY_DN7936_c0_g1_i1.p1 TRINITY_DN7936_c0_g1~~TRINITY_DN7936_c0_g1_i1.p1  ORF type:complete len:385 (-),score=80.63 TRINITY_DN7936_c0_g1_i1:161-1315(-)